LSRGFVYLVAVIDWYSRYVLSWELSNTLDAQFCIDAVNDSMSKYGVPTIFNSDQGSQFTSDDFISLLLDNEVKISFDGRGRCLDNVRIERFWRSLKYEEVYMKDYKSYTSIKDASLRIGEYIKHYNHARFHQSLGYEVPKKVYIIGGGVIPISLQ
jgi:putative transposase